MNPNQCSKILAHMWKKELDVCPVTLSLDGDVRCSGNSCFSPPSHLSHSSLTKVVSLLGFFQVLQPIPPEGMQHLPRSFEPSKLSSILFAALSDFREEPRAQEGRLERHRPKEVLPPHSFSFLMLVSCFVHLFIYYTLFLF